MSIAKESALAKKIAHVRAELVRLREMLEFLEADAPEPKRTRKAKPRVEKA